jgi:hypothetical protein
MNTSHQNEKATKNKKELDPGFLFPVSGYFLLPLTSAHY